GRARQDGAQRVSQFSVEPGLQAGRLEAREFLHAKLRDEGTRGAFQAVVPGAGSGEFHSEKRRQPVDAVREYTRAAHAVLERAERSAYSGGSAATEELSRLARWSGASGVPE